MVIANLVRNNVVLMMAVRAQHTCLVRNNQDFTNATSGDKCRKCSCHVISKSCGTRRNCSLISLGRFPMLHACVPSYFAIAIFFFQNRLAELLLRYTSFCEIELEEGLRGDRGAGVVRVRAYLNLTGSVRVIYQFNCARSFIWPSHYTTYKLVSGELQSGHF